MIKVTNVIGGCVSSQRLENVIVDIPAKKGIKQTASVNWNKNQVIKIKTFCIERICLLR